MHYMAPERITAAAYSYNSGVKRGCEQLHGVGIQLQLSFTGLGCSYYSGVKRDCEQLHGVGMQLLLRCEKGL
eukprot:scaffold2652_cov94-Isochrysis_galbana.AAC.1